MKGADVGRAAAILVAAGGLIWLVAFVPLDRQSGDPVPGDPRAGRSSGLTSYCLPDESGVRMYERPFPQGGTQPLFAVLYAGDLPAGNPARCEVAR